MSIIIKGMDMPKSCEWCKFICEKDYYYCAIISEELDILDISERPCWCPLVEVPTPHGDLIDKDLLPEQFAYADYNFEMTVEYAPTVIEAEWI